MTLNEMFEKHGIYLGSVAFRAVEDVVKAYIQQETEHFSQHILELGLDSISCDYAKEDWNIYQEWEEVRWSLNIDNSQFAIHN